MFKLKICHFFCKFVLKVISKPVCTGNGGERDFFVDHFFLSQIILFYNVNKWF